MSETAIREIYRYCYLCSRCEIHIDTVCDGCRKPASVLSGFHYHDDIGRIDGDMFSVAARPAPAEREDVR